MSVLGFADKLMTETERNAEEISRQACKHLRESAKTPWYHSLSEQECFYRSREFFQNLRRIYFCKPPYTEMFEYFEQFAVKRYREGVPLEEVIYKLVILRRQMWIITESKSLVVTGLDLQKSVESINKMIRIFDQGIWAVIKKYGELDSKEKKRLMERATLKGIIKSWFSKSRI
ncbi:MAG: hypothetical protein JXA35_04030 [Deltaproteobacteria bacterium]|nr:hypothetical protein [Deltaproteobacteria bacterium]HEN20453.1 hypothetical protein [Desulfobacteraceae bacterium]